MNDSEHALSCDCGYETTESHTFDNVCLDEEKHTPVCSCGYEAAPVSHDLKATYNSDGHFMVCDCGYTINFTAHELAPKFDSDNHWLECACGYKKDVTAHSLEYTSAAAAGHTKGCECGFETGVLPHTELKAVYESDTKHIHECACGYTESKDGALTLEYNSEGHYYVCACEGKYKTESAEHVLVSGMDENVHFVECECGYKNETAHTFKTSFVDGTEHFSICECGYTKDNQEHNLVLNHSDGSGHWYECTECDYTTEKVSHVCKLFTDDEGHSLICDCGYASVPYTYHTVSNYEITKMPTCQEDGIITYYCECGISAEDVLSSTLYGAHANLKHVPGYEATCTVVGRVEYWFCQDCGNFFADEDATVIIPDEEHTYIYKSHDFENGEWVLNENGTSHAKECANCGILSAWSEHIIKRYATDESSHWVGCECGFTKAGTVAEEHSFVYAYDTGSHYFYCSVCGYTSSEEHYLIYNMNEDYHWLECICGFKTPELLHKYTECHNEDIHYEVCPCGSTRNEAEHTLVLRPMRTGWIAQAAPTPLKTHLTSLKSSTATLSIGLNALVA